MRVTITPEDGFVSVDKVGFMGLLWEGTPDDVHALQWDSGQGWIEYENACKPNEPITALPYWANNAVAAWNTKNNEPPVLLPTIEENTRTAERFLNQTEWIFEPHVANPSEGDSVLLNRQRFLDFHATVLNLLKNVHAGPMQFPVMPETVWQRPDTP
jgi:hypothetical protein